MRAPLRLFVALLAAVIPSLAGAAPDERTYLQPPFLQWAKADLDVLIVPPNHGQIYNDEGVLAGPDARELDPRTNSYLRAIEDGIADWQKAVRTFGSRSLRKALKMKVYVLGRDDVPQEALNEPEIVVYTDETKTFVLGVAAQAGPSPCLVNNSKIFVTSFTYADMYNVNGQEFGHCLGLGHTTGRPPDEVIAHDVMNGSYADTPGSAGTHLHCMSNLNVKGLEYAFAAVTGKPASEIVEMPAQAYRQIRCKHKD